MVLIVSPHIDDAVLSIGGLMMELTQRKIEVEVIYVFSVSDWTNADAIEKKVYNIGVDEITRLRKDEENKVSSLMGYNTNYLDFCDLPIRLANKEVDQHQTDRISERLLSSIKLQDLIFFPVGINHPDHVVIGEIGRAFLSDGYKVVLYEDLPYFGRSHNHFNAYARLRALGLKPVSIKINPIKKMEFIEMYTSQVSMDWLNDINNYSYNLVDHEYYERFWIDERSEIQIL